MYVCDFECIFSLVNFTQEFLDINTLVDSTVIEKKIGEINSEITAMWTSLMGYEMQLVDQLEVSTVVEFLRR